MRLQKRCRVGRKSVVASDVSDACQKQLFKEVGVVDSVATAGVGGKMPRSFHLSFGPVGAIVGEGQHGVPHGSPRRCNRRVVWIEIRQQAFGQNLGKETPVSGFQDMVPVGIRPQLVQERVDPLSNEAIGIPGSGLGTVTSRIRTGSEGTFRWGTIPLEEGQPIRIQTADRLEGMTNALQQEIPT
jgi:hypothetical protein